MDSIQNTMSKIIRNCDVCIDGNVVSKELLIKTFSGFISSTIEDKRHNVGIVLHTGSICFDAILLAYAAISDVLYNETNANDIISSLQADDMVLCYDGSKGKSKPSKWIQGLRKLCRGESSADPRKVYRAAKRQKRAEIFA